MLNELSLFYPAGKQPGFHLISQNTYNDLSVDVILDCISETEAEKKILKQMMLELENGPDVIRYCCDIFEDMLKFPVLREKMKEMLEQLDYLNTLGRSFKDDSIAPVWQLVKRLRELETYIDCITGIHQALSDHPISSVGLKQLKEYVASVYNSSGFDHFKADINDLLTETARIQSITLGINLDNMMRPTEVGILSINEERFEHSGILDNFLGFCSKFVDILNSGSATMTKIHTSGVSAEDDPLMKNLSRAVTDMLEPLSST